MRLPSLAGERMRLRILIPVLTTIAVPAVVLFVYSFFGGAELAVGNLVLRVQSGTSYPLQAPTAVANTGLAYPAKSEGSGLSARNAILFIGDGMGIGAVSAASDLLERPGFALEMTATPHVALVRTWATDNLAPDSAATATAMATGFKTRKKAVGVLEDGTSVENLFEVARANGRSTGVITTSGLVDATPASFTVHAGWRDDYHEIFEKMLASGTDLMIGGDWVLFDKARRNREYLNLVSRAEELGQDHGYQVIRDQNSMESAKLPLLALFPRRPVGGNSHGPSLAETTRRAVELLGEDPDGFLLLVETEITDELGHSNDIVSVMDGMRELNEAVAAALAMTRDAGETLVVVTADHDTGSLAVVGGGYEEGRATVRWATGKHSSQWVPLFSFGPGAERFRGVLDNTEVGKLAAQALGFYDLARMADNTNN